jgi:hypothetical protein
MLHQTLQLLLLLLLLRRRQPREFLPHHPRWTWVTWAWTQTRGTLQAPLLLLLLLLLGLLPSRLQLVAPPALLVLETAHQCSLVSPQARTQPVCCCCYWLAGWLGLLLLRVLLLWQVLVPQLPLSPQAQLGLLSPAQPLQQLLLLQAQAPATQLVWSHPALPGDHGQGVPQTQALCSPLPTPASLPRTLHYQNLHLLLQGLTLPLAGLLFLLLVRLSPLLILPLLLPLQLLVLLDLWRTPPCC